MNFEARTILRKALDILSGSEQWTPEDFRWAQGFTERSIESTWLADRLRASKAGQTLLDIGFSLSSLDTLGVLLEAKKKGLHLTALDIVSPERVISRYPEAWTADIRQLPCLQADVLTYAFAAETYDWVTCISTLEHVGFDEVGETAASAFNRTMNPQDITLSRDPETITVFMKQVQKALKKGGKLFLTLPYGLDAPRILRDSLGYYCAYWENGDQALERIFKCPGLRVAEVRFFRVNSEWIWVESERRVAAQVTNSLFKPNTEACVTLEIEKV